MVLEYCFIFSIPNTIFTEIILVQMENYTKSSFSIKSWAEEDRPREKMQLKGKHSLSDAELLAILMGSGNREESAVVLGQKILQSVGCDLNELSKKNIKELMKFKGVGEAKAISIIAALEIGRRRQLTDIKTRPQIKSSRTAYDLLAPLLIDLPHEEFWILLLNRGNRVMGREKVSMGGVTGTVVDGKVIFKKALLGNATSIILCHNHPSGTLRPSQPDIDITKKLKMAGKTLDISVVDHLIISELGYYSFADEGMM